MKEVCPNFIRDSAEEQIVGLHHYPGMIARQPRSNSLLPIGAQFLQAPSEDLQGVVDIEHVSGAIFAAAPGVDQDFLRKEARRVRDLQLLSLFRSAGQIEFDHPRIDKHDVDMPELLRGDACNLCGRSPLASAVIGASHEGRDELSVEP